VPRALFAGLGGFKSATRVAASPPEMWRDILLENRTFVLSSLDRYTKELKAVRGLIGRRDGVRLFRYLAQSQMKRLEIP
jgi:prephenate dehydrogenase